VNTAQRLFGACALLVGSSTLAASPVLRETPDGLFISGPVDCAIVVNRGVDTMAEALSTEDGTPLLRMATWRGREGRYVVVSPAGATDLRLSALGRSRIDSDDVRVEACPEALDAGTARAMAEFSDLRLAGYFGGVPDSPRLQALLDRALSGLPAQTLPGWRADLLFEAAEWHRDGGRTEAATAAWSGALAHYRTLGNERGEAAAVNALGLAAWRQGDTATAVERFDQALVLRRRLGDDFAAAVIRNNLGLIAAERGDPAAALGHYQEALSIFQNGIELRQEITGANAAEQVGRIADDGDLGSALNTLNNLAQLYRDIGQPAIAERYWRNYLAFEAYLPEAIAVAQARHNLGLMLQAQGRLDEALRLLLQARERFDALAAGRWQAESRVGLSRLYLELGDRDGALVLVEQALALPIEDRRARARALRQSARLALDLGEAGMALAALQTASALLETGIALREGAGLATELAEAEMELGRLAAARERQEQNLMALEGSDLPAVSAQARSLLGEILLRQGDPQAAIVNLEEALAVQQRLGLRLAELETLERLGRAQERSDPAAARSTYGRAIDLLDDPRVRSLPELRRAGFRERNRAIYERQVQLLLDADQVAAAWVVGERARNGDLTTLRRERQRRRAEPGQNRSLDRHASLLAQLHLLTTDSPPDGDEIQWLRTELDRLEDDLRPDPPTTPVPSLSSVRSALAPDQRLLSFLLGERRGWVWIIGGSQDRAFLIEDLAGLRTDVQALLAQLRHPRHAVGRISALSQALRDRLPAPVHAAVANAGDLLIQPDRELHALPFSLLWLGAEETRGPLRLRRLLSVVAGVERGRDEGGARLLVVADPGWDRAAAGDSIYPESSLLNRLVRDSALAGLPGTRNEAEAILALGRDDIEIQLRMGPFATREFVLDGGAAGYSHLHFATHGLVDLDYPELSALLLASEIGAGPAFLRPSDIASLKIDADLVVLSGCDTGHGRVFAGSGAFSLARPFLLAGADQVLASLWKVDDYRTAQFMSRFYHYLFTESLTAAQALAETRKWMRAQRASAHPYYWAGFVLSSRGFLMSQNDL
jgi:CHAT domain-containing protein/tetratricopeptide (TPR) repeat protein